MNREQYETANADLMAQVVTAARFGRPMTDRRVRSNYEGPNPADEFADEEAAEADSIESRAYDALTGLSDADLVNTAWPNPTDDNADWQALALRVMARHLRGLIAKHETSRHLLRDDEDKLVGLMHEATMREVRA